MLTLVLGGTRSGKSAVGEKLAAARGDAVTYLATATVGDADMSARVRAHQNRRPSGWATVEAGYDLAAAVRSIESDQAVVVDSLTTWIADAPDFVVDVADLCAALAGRSALTVVVSDEVGMGVHPSGEVGRRFRDALGLLNQAVAAVADEVLLVVAGRILRLEQT